MPKWPAFSMLPVASPRLSSSRFNRVTAPRQAQQQQQQQHGNETAQNQKHNKKKRYPEEYRRDLEYRRNPRLVPYEGRTRRTFHTSRHYPHYQGQEAEPVYEHAVCPGGARDAVRKQGRSRHPKLNGCDLYVCRVTKTGEFGCSKPCWRW
jgi:hypothetical protein